MKNLTLVTMCLGVISILFGIIGILFYKSIEEPLTLWGIIIKTSYESNLLQSGIFLVTLGLSLYYYIRTKQKKEEKSG